MLIYYACIPIAVLLLRRFLFSRIQAPLILRRSLLITTILLLLAYSAAIILSHYNIYWRGYQSTRWLYIASAVSSVLFYWFHKSNKPDSFLTLATGIIAFILSGTSALLFDVMSDDDGQLFYNDPKYRLEETFYGLGYPKLPKLFVKEGLFEKSYIINKDYDNPANTHPTESYIPKEKIVKIEVKEIGDKKVSITFFHTADTNRVRKNPLNFIVDLR